MGANNSTPLSHERPKSKNEDAPSTPQFRYVEVPVKKPRNRKQAADELKEHYSSLSEPWRQKIQPLYETQKDRARLGRMIGGSIIVSEEDKKAIDQIRNRNKL